MTSTDLEAALRDTNVQAFLRVIRQGETNQGDDAYRMLFGGGLFNSFSNHPRQAITRGRLTSTAAGAYQFLARTWDGLVKQYGFRDFSPHSQDLGAVALVLGRKALDDVIAGRIEQAVRKCNREWASLPESPYGQPTRTMAQAIETYREWGGVLRPAGTQAPIETINVAPDVPAQEAHMGPFIAAAIPALLDAVPKLGALFSSGSEVAERNVKAAEVVVQVAKDAIGAKNEQELVETLRTDPQAAQQVREAVEREWYAITEAGGGGIDGARKANAEASAHGWQATAANPAMWVAAALLPLVYIVVWTVLQGDFTSEVKAMVVAAVVSGVLGSITGYFLGTSLSSAKKDDALAARK